MSMLVRKGTMLHRTSSSRRNSRRNSSISRPSRERAASVAPSIGAGQSSLTATAVMATPHATGTSPRASRGSLPGPLLPGSSTQGNALTAPTNESESRRSSNNSVSQMSTDDRKRLYDDVGRVGVTPSYGSIVYQMRDASDEATGTCDFVIRALSILVNSAAATFLLVCFAALPLLMVVLGVQHLRDCPKEPNIPIYLLVGGCFGLLRLVLLLWQQTRSRRYDRLDPLGDSSLDMDAATATCTRFMEGVLSLFLMGWFAAGNYWAYKIYEPLYEAPLLAPNNWCHKTVYSFTLIQLLICYGIMAGVVVLVLCLAIGHKVTVLLSGEYK